MIKNGFADPNPHYPHDSNECVIYRPGKLRRLGNFDETDLPADSVYGARSVPFFKQAKHTGNLSVGYNRESWDIRLAANYRSSYLDEIGDEPLADRYTDDFVQVDLTARYSVNDNLIVTAEAMNLNDQPEYYYFGNTSRLSQYDEYGTTYGFGLRWTF